MKFKHMLKATGRYLARKSPQIAIIFGIAGIGLTVYETAKVTKRIIDKIAQDECAAEKNLTEKEKAVIIAKTAWPVALMAVGTAGCFIFAFGKQTKRLGLVTSGLQLANAQLKSYEDTILDELGKEKADEIHKKWVKSRAQEKIDEVPPEDIPMPILDNEYLFYEPLTGTPFISTFEDVYNAMRFVNDMRDSDPFSGPTAFRQFLMSLPTLKDACNADIGVVLGFREKKDYKDHLEVIVEDVIKTAKGPAYLIEYNPPPTWIGYDY